MEAAPGNGGVAVVTTTRASELWAQKGRSPRTERHEPVPRPRTETALEKTSENVRVPAPGTTVVRDVAVGLLFQAQDQVRSVVRPLAEARTATTITPVAGTILGVGRRVARLPLIHTAGRQAATRLDRARERGTREVEDHRQRMDAMVREVASAVMRSQAMEDIVAEVTKRFATPIVEAQLPVVIERLGERPEVLRPIVDETVERFAVRFMTAPSARPSGKAEEANSS